MSQEIAPWANAHAQRFKTPLQRFTEKYIVNDETGCWEWQAARRRGSGYGIENANGIPTNAHRVGYAMLVGPIPAGLVLDHLCGNTSCVNPDHLQPVTQAENRRRQAERQTHCRNGHPLSGPNLALVRVCRTCRDATEQRHVEKQRRERAA